MIELTEVDGVPTLYSPRSGPTQAGLTFRVGQADETLARAGITHLVEHLALHNFGMADYHYNGSTGSVITTFHLQGSDTDVSAFLTGICTALSNPPLDRLEMEREILRTEASSRSRSVLEPMAIWRYGARTHGLPGFPEWGLSMVSPHDVRDWVARYFTKGNAVLWVGGAAVPAGLRLPLPSGPRQPVATPTSALPQTPAYFCGSSRAVGFEGLTRRSPAGSLFAGVLGRELFRTLRQEGGLSYAATALYEPRGDGYASVTALADSLPEKHDAVLGGFIDVLAKLRVGRFEQSDVDAVLAKAEDGLSHTDIDALRLPACAFNFLTGYPNVTAAEYLDQVRAVTHKELHATATEVLDSGLLMVPEGRDAAWAGYHEAPTQSGKAVDGKAYAAREASDHKVIIGSAGVSNVSQHNLGTVTYDECAAILMWPDGGRLLIGNDGITVRIEPTVHATEPTSIEYVDDHVDRERHVLMPARSPDAIPQPRPKAKVVKPPRFTRSTAATVLSILSFVTAGCLFGSWTMTTAFGRNPKAAAPEWISVGVSWGLFVVLAVATIALAVRFIRRGKTA